MGLFSSKKVYTYDSEQKDADNSSPPTPVTFPEPEVIARAVKPPKVKEKKFKPVKEKQVKEKIDGERLPISIKGVVGISGIVVALFLLFVLSPIATRMANEQMGTALLALKDIPKGSPIDATLFEAAEMPLKSIPKNAISAAHSISGWYAQTDISSGDYILDNKVSEKVPFEDDYLYTMPDELIAMSIKIKGFENGLAGKLIKGDVVSIFASISSGDKTEGYLALAPPELKYVQVLSVTASNAKDYDRTALEDSKGETDEELPATVELMVNERQAQALAGLNSNATIHLALVSRGNPDYELHLLQLQTDFLVQQAAEEAARKQEIAEAQETATSGVTANG